MGCLHQIPRLRAQGILQKRPKELRANQMEDDKKQERSKSTWSKHIWRHRDWNSIHRACTRGGSRAERRREHRTQTQNKQRTLKGRMPDNKLIGTFVASLSHSVMPGPFIHFNLFLVPSLGLLPFSLFVYLLALFSFAFQSQCVGSCFTLLYSTFLFFQ